MKSRRDQVQAYFFVVGRLVAGLVQGRPDAPEHPNKRFSGGTVLGVLLAGVLVAVFGIYGLFVPGGNTSWRAEGAIVLEKETGARYVHLDGQLRPVLNTASALLAAGAGGTMVSVSRGSLTGVPVGTPIGIPGAPDGLPSAAALNTARWTVCARPADPEAVASAPGVTLRLDRAEGQVVPGDKGLVVSVPAAPGQGNHLVWRGTRYRIPDMLMLEALGYVAERVIPVAPAWLNAIPAGPDLRPPVLDRTGGQGPAVGGRPGLVGQVFEVRNPAISSDEFYVLRGDGLMPVNRTTAAMLLAAPTTRAAYPDGPVRPIVVGPDALAGVPLVEAPPTNLPPGPPPLADVPTAEEPCLRFDLAAGDRAPALVLLPVTGEKAGVPPAGRHLAGGTADQVVIPAGSGALVRSLPAPSATPGTLYLITDLGVRYPLSEKGVAATLGYGAVRGVDISPALLSLLPAGPVLDPEDAVASQVVEAAKPPPHEGSSPG